MYRSSAWRGSVDGEAKADIALGVPTDKKPRFGVDLEAGRGPRQ